MLFFLNKSAQRDCLMNTAGDQHTNCKQPYRCTCDAQTCTAHSHALNIKQKYVKTR